MKKITILILICLNIHLFAVNLKRTDHFIYYMKIYTAAKSGNIKAEDIAHQHKEYIRATYKYLEGFLNAKCASEFKFAKYKTLQQTDLKDIDKYNNLIVKNMGESCFCPNENMTTIQLARNIQKAIDDDESLLNIASIARLLMDIENKLCYKNNVQYLNTPVPNYAYKMDTVKEVVAFEPSENGTAQNKTLFGISSILQGIANDMEEGNKQRDKTYQDHQRREIIRRLK